MTHLSNIEPQHRPRTRGSWRALAAFACALFAAACGSLIDIPDRAPAVADADAAAPTDAGVAIEAAADAGPEAEADSNALAALTTSHGTLTPAFSPTTFAYTVSVSDLFGVLPFTVTATTATRAARVTIDGNSAASGVASAPFTLAGVRTKKI